MHEDKWFEANRKAWNDKTEVHVNSDFYDVGAFKAGQSTLPQVDLEWIGKKVMGKKVLHLQCHFGLDSLSLERLGAVVTGVDLSDTAIANAEKIRDELGMKSRFICCNIYDLPKHLDETFDWVYTSYGTIGWLPDLKPWSQIINRFLKPGGSLFFAEFHPFIWTMDNDFLKPGHYNYFKEDQPLVEIQQGTYADRDAPIQTEMYSWNHALGEVLGCLLQQDLQLKRFEEFDYSPWPCFPNLDTCGLNMYRMKQWGAKVPYFYALIMKKPH